MKKYLILAALLVGCVSVRDPWDRYAIHTYDSRYNSRRLLYPSKDYSGGLTLELIYCKKELSGFFNLTRGQRVKAGEVELTIEAEDVLETFILEPNKGNQRVKISPEALELITETLLDRKNVTVNLDGYEQVYEYKKFNKHFKDLKKKQLKIIQL
ncbi:MAG: hypothetical protein SP1CHLAM54_04580 [Chlamydiia bacterium]|nr:hypothetical protein [Chlamydiia bacterium]MCH9615370.1 hypothetical protein [Chlamydiia bacterium]MCH9628308.1 hypothetical protein [Chlamydiia bacterium]